LEIEKNELQCLAETRVDILKQERKEREKSQMNILSLEVDEKRKLLDLLNNRIENAKIKLSNCKNLFAEAVLVDNELENCTKGTWAQIISYLKLFINIFKWFFFLI